MEEVVKRAFKGIWIPANIWLSKDLTVMEKMFLVEIDSLDNEEGCFASNRYFAEFFDLSKNRCSEIIKSLEQKSKVLVTYVRNGKEIESRVIKVRDGVFDSVSEGIRKTEGGIRKTDRGYSENRRGYSENTEDNNTINNTIERERTALDFLKNNYLSVYESLVMKYKSKILDFDKACDDFNLKFDQEDLSYESKIINARAQRFFNRWVDNQLKYSQVPVSQDRQSEVYKSVRF